MPTDHETRGKRKAFADRLKAGMAHAGYADRGNLARFAAAYGVKAPVVTQWRDGKYLPTFEKVRIMAKEFGCDAEWLYSGEGEPPEWFGGNASSAVASIFTPERRAEDDVTAVQIAIESLAVALLKRSQGASTAFLADLDAVTRLRKFSKNHALLGRLVNIAESVQSDEAKEARAARCGASARRTKP